MTKNFQQSLKKLFASFAVVSTLALPAFAQESTTAEEILFDPAVSAGDINQFEISPDGTRIAMVGSFSNEDSTNDTDQTYVAPLLSGVTNPATLVLPSIDRDHDGGVAWTPDGLFVTVRYEEILEGTNEIFLVPADGSGTSQQLTFDSINAFDPQISSDGSLFFYSDGGGLFVTPIAGASASSSIQLNAGDISEIDTGSYAQVGSSIIFSGFPEPNPEATNSTPDIALYLTAADGSTASSPTRIPIDNLTATNPDGVDIDNVQVTPNGQTILLRGDLLTDNQDELFSLPISGGDATPLIAGPLRDNFDMNYFIVSPDGSTVAFVGDYLTDGVAEAFIIPITGGVPVRVSDSAGFDQTNGFDVGFSGVDSLQFSPDGTSLYYLSDADDNGRFRLFRVAIDSTPTVLLGDINQDETIDFLDIAPFISVLSSGGLQAEADVNQDGAVDFLDIAPFISLLSNN